MCLFSQHFHTEGNFHSEGNFSIRKEIWKEHGWIFYIRVEKEKEIDIFVLKQFIIIRIDSLNLTHFESLILLYCCH